MSCVVDRREADKVISAEETKPEEEAAAEEPTAQAAATTQEEEEKVCCLSMPEICCYHCVCMSFFEPPFCGPVGLIPTPKPLSYH